jgi:hypothetical protein
MEKLLNVVTTSSDAAASTESNFPGNVVSFIVTEPASTDLRMEEN